MAHRGWKRDGFTPAKKAAAVKALGKYGTVADAARAVGVSANTIFRHLNKDPEFERLCRLAREAAAKPIETLAWERATVGAEEVVVRGGEVVQVRRKPSDSMLRMLLQASNPKKYGRMSRGGETRRQIERRVRKQVEAEFDAQGRGRRPRVASNEEVEAALVKRLAAFGRRVAAADEERRRAGGEAERDAAGGEA
jgi:hypothetical protein